MREAGAYLTTSECMLLGLCGDAAHPKFKPIQKLIFFFFFFTPTIFFVGRCSDGSVFYFSGVL
jgi:hypothetical protein